MEVLSSSHHARMSETTAGGWLTEGIGGLAAVVLSILALVGVLPAVLAPIAAIIIGVALMIGAGTTAAQFSTVMTGRPEVMADADTMAGSETAGEVMFGIAGIVLGIIALIGGPTTLNLLAITVIIFGAGILLSSGRTSRLAAFVGRRAATGAVVRDVMPRAASAGFEVLVGAGAIVLGILALNRTDTATMVYVGLLSCAAAIMATGASFWSRVFGPASR